MRSHDSQRNPRLTGGEEVNRILLQLEGRSLKGTEDFDRLADMYFQRDVLNKFPSNQIFH